MKDCDRMPQPAWQLRSPPRGGPGAAQADAGPRAHGGGQADFGRTVLRSASYALDTGGGDSAAVTLDEGGATKDGEPQPAQAAKPSCGEAITWTPKSPVPTDIIANSAVEFAARIDAALSGDPHTQASYAFNSDIQNGKMVSVNMTVETSIIRPRWSGGRCSAAEQTLIKRVETFIQEHEQRHRDITRAVAQQAVCDAKGKPLAQAKAVLKKAICDTEPTQQEALDNKEGRLTWVKDSTGAVVDFGSAGEKHDYHQKGCDPFGAAPEQPKAQQSSATPGEGDAAT